MGQYRTADGSVVEVDDNYARGLGMTPVTEQEIAKSHLDAALSARESERGLLGTINAAASSALSGATLGLSDVALGALMTEGEREQFAGDRHANETVSTVANIAGGLATSFAAPGSVLARTPAGAVAQVANRGVAVGRAAGGVGGAARVAAYSGGEAALQMAGSYLSDVALGDRELSAEGMAGALGRGFAFGAVAGSAMYGIERGAMNARRMFPKAGAAKAAELADTTFTAKSTEILDSHDQLIEIARKRLEEANAQIASGAQRQAQLKAEAAGVRAEMAAAKAKPTTVADVPPSTATPETPTTAAPESFAPTAVDTPTPAPAAAPATLEAQLAEMQSRVSQGATLQDLNAARTATPRQVEELQEALTELTENRAKADAIMGKQGVAAWVERLRNPRVQHHGINVVGSTNANSGFGRVRSTFASDVPVEQSGGQIRIIGAKENPLESLTPNSRLIGADVVPDRELGRALDEEYHEAIDMARTAASKEERQFALEQAAGIEDKIHSLARGQRSEVDAVIDRIESLRKQHGRSAMTSAEKRLYNQQDRYTKAGESHMLPMPERQAPIPRQPTRKPDQPPVKQPSTVDEVAEAAEVLAANDKSAAKLTDLLGDDAPQVARDARDAFRKAEQESERKATDRMARAIDDHVDGKTKLASIRQRQRETRASIAKAKADKAAAEADLLTPRPQPAADPTSAISLPPTPAADGNRLSSLADLGAVLEAADTIGIPGLPRPSDLPVVGPLLGLYLKYRAVKAIAGRMTGRVPATGDARAAALAAKTRDRAMHAADRMLGLVEKSAPPARSLAVRVGGVLSKPLYDDGDENPSKDASPRELAAARIRELSAAATNPQMIAARVREQMADVSDPDLIAAAEQHEIRKVQYLHDKAPKEPPPLPLAQRKWAPSQTETMKFARRLEVADDPIAAIEQVEQRCLTPEAAEAFRTLYPKLFAEVQSRFIERAAEVKATVPREQRYRMGLLLDIPLDRLSQPETMATLQSVFATPANAPSSPAEPMQQVPPVPSTAGPVDLAAIYTTPADRRAARR